MSLRLTPPPAFVVVGATMATFLAASSAPSPLYPAYEEAFGFGPATLTVVFAVYVLALLAALLVVGRLSDHVGRRPVLAAALLLELGALALFLGAEATPALVAARVVQGLATGAAMGVMGAFLLDLQRHGTQRGAVVNGVAPLVGLALGGVVAGALADLAPEPLRLVYAVLGGLVLTLLLAVPFLPETAPRRPGALRSMRPVVAVPAAARRTFATSVPVMAATWSLGGLMLSVSGSVLATRFAVPGHLVAGLVLGAFTGTGALASYVGRERPPADLRRFGLVALVAGLVAFVAALVLTLLPLLVVAVVVAGAGFGSAFLGALRAVSALALTHERAGLMSAVYVVSYLAFSVPALVAGAVTLALGLDTTTVGYAVLVGLVATAALAVELRTRVARCPSEKPCSSSSRASAPAPSTPSSAPAR